MRAPPSPRSRALCVRLAAAWTALLVLSFAGCFSGLDNLAPFPCAEDGDCPEGYDCVDLDKKPMCLPFCTDSTRCNEGDSCVHGNGSIEVCK